MSLSLSIDNTVLPAITIHLVPKDGVVEIEKGIGVNLVAIENNFNETRLKRDARYLVGNGILNGSATNSNRFECRYLAVPDAYNEFGSLNEFLSKVGPVNPKPMDIVTNLHTNASVQEYLIFVMFAVRAWLDLNSSPESKKEITAQAKAIDLIQTDSLFQVWNTTVTKYLQTSPREFECTTNAIKFNLNFNLDLNILELFEEMLGIGSMSVNVKSYDRNSANIGT